VDDSRVTQIKPVNSTGRKQIAMPRQERDLLRPYQQITLFGEKITEGQVDRRMPPTLM